MAQEFDPNRTGSKDDQGNKSGGDHDQDYRMGNPRGNLSVREQARLDIFKAKANREVEKRKAMERKKE